MRLLVRDFPILGKSLIRTDDELTQLIQLAELVALKPQTAGLRSASCAIQCAAFSAIINVGLLVFCLLA